MSCTHTRHHLTRALCFNLKNCWHFTQQHTPSSNKKNIIYLGGREILVRDRIQLFIAKVHVWLKSKTIKITFKLDKLRLGKEKKVAQNHVS